MLRFKPATAAYEKQIATLDLHSLSYIESLAAAICSVQDSASEPASGSYLDLKLYFKHIFFFLSQNTYM